MSERTKYSLSPMNRKLPFMSLVLPEYIIGIQTGFKPLPFKNSVSRSILKD
jgi:hypothetical protein